MRVDQAEAMAVPGILQGEIEQERRLAGPGLADQVEMREPVPERDPKRRRVLIPAIGHAENGGVAREHSRIVREAMRRG